MATRHTRRIARTGRPIPGKENLVFLVKKRGGVLLPDSIGLSANALWDALPAELRPIFCIDRDNRRDVSEAFALARVSEYLNMCEMIGRGELMILVYRDGTESTILLRACKVCRVTFGEQYYDTDYNGVSVFGTPDIGAVEYR